VALRRGAALRSSRLLQQAVRETRYKKDLGSVRNYGVFNAAY